MSGRPRLATPEAEQQLASAIAAEIAQLEQRLSELRLQQTALRRRVYWRGYKQVRRADALLERLQRFHPAP
jgi:hypothetical protein